MVIDLVCTDAFWDHNLTWATDTPRLTRCLSDVGFSIVPSAIVMLLMLFEFQFNIRTSTARPIRPNKYNRGRQLICFLAVLSNLILLANYCHAILFSYTEQFTFADLLTTTSKLMVFILFALVHHSQRKSGVITSGCVFVASLVLSICSLVTLLDSRLYNSAMYSDFEVTNFYQIALCSVGLFVFNCFADDAIDAGLKPRPQATKPKDDDSVLLNHMKNSDKSEDSSESCERNVSPRVYSSFLSRITFFWFTEFFKTISKKKTIDHTDLWELEDDMKMETISEQFNREFVNEMKYVEQRNQTSKSPVKFNSWNTIRLACRFRGKAILLLQLMRLVCDCMTFVRPILLSFMIRFISDPNEKRWHGILLVIGFVVCTIFEKIVDQTYYQKCDRVNDDLEAGFINLLYSKAMSMSNKARNKSTTGKIINLITSDIYSISSSQYLLEMIWSSPFQIVFGIYLLYQQLGRGVYFGCVIIVLTMLVQYYIGKLRKRWYEDEQKNRDNRVKLLHELLTGIKIVKLYGWETAFSKKISDAREKEVEYLKKTYLCNLVNWSMFTFTPALFQIIALGTYIFFSNEEVTVEKAFVSIMIFDIIDFPIGNLPSIVTQFSTSKVNLERISKFLAQDSLDNYVKREHDEKIAITIRNKARFVWETRSEDDEEEEKEEKNEKKKNKDKKKTNDHSNDQSSSDESSTKSESPKKPFELKDIELEIPKGQLIAVIGQVAAGKSSLISAILGEMELIENDLGEKGQMNISDELGISYVAQQAWIQNDTFRGNILFGKPYNQSKYDEVVSACCLTPDLDQFEGGDLTEIGEKGITLSGGQKQRVALARACYSAITSGNSKQIVLLDDVLSAVDAHVGKSLCDDVLNSRTGILRGTTRILVTNQLNQLGDLDVDQIVLLKDGRIELKCTYDGLLEMEKNGQLDEYNLRLSQNQKTDEEDKSSEAGSQKSSEEKNQGNQKATSKSKKLIEKEKQEVGEVNWKHYYVYLKHFGYFNALVILLFVVLNNYFEIYSQVYLAEWTKSKPNTTDPNVIRSFHWEHMIYYSLFSLGECVFDMLEDVVLLVGVLSTFRLFHKQLLYKILRSPMRFFEQTPVGRIIGRFSGDMNRVDQSLPRNVRGIVFSTFRLLASLSLLIVKTDASLILCFGITLTLQYLLMNKHINSSRQLKRYKATTRSPVLTHITETLNGLPTIRAFGKVNEFEKGIRSKIDIRNRTSWISTQGHKWLNFNLSCLSSLVLLVVSVQTVLRKDQLNGGEAALLITYALSITWKFTRVLRSTGHFKELAVSIERINEYLENEEEDAWVKDVRPAADWPRNGEIEFIDYSTRYREDTSLVLKDLNFKVNGAEKVGVVGRTGAGKSSCTLALFRIIEPAAGRIVIDGVDISKIGLHDLKSRLSIIPQDPVLFTGTIRFNLDPFDNYSDEEIRTSLEHAHLMDYVNSLEDGIHHKIAEGGENLSVGQRQLICLARALLRKSKILVLDEATASVDFATDELVQKTIRSEFRNYTTITIAHRLNTVLDSSRVLVLDHGELEEYDAPEKLLKNPDSAFYSLALKANVI